MFSHFFAVIPFLGLNRATMFSKAINARCLSRVMFTKLRNMATTAESTTQTTLHKKPFKLDDGPNSPRQWSSEPASNYDRDMELTHQMDSTELLKRILHEHTQLGKTFILPWADPDAMKLVNEPLQKLLDEGIRPEFLLDACVKREELFRAFIKQGPKLLKIIELLMECTGQTYENTMRFVADWTEELLSVSPESISSRLSVFLSRGILSGGQILRVIKVCPLLLFASEPQKMDVALETIAEFFPPDEMKAIMMTSPQVCLQDPEQLVLRYEYIYFHMAIEPDEFSECIRWHELPLEEIMARHEVLKRAGKYFLPDPKRPQLKMENPSMFRIFDTEDAEFATQVAGIRCEEWTLFRQLFEKERAQMDLERPYDRVKPSLRKLYARKKAAADSASTAGHGESDELF